MFKLVAVIEGEAFGAYLDARPGSRPEERSSRRLTRLALQAGLV
jgi:hypothetical protein